MHSTIKEAATAYIEAMYFTEGGPDNPEFDDAACSGELIAHAYAAVGELFARFGERIADSEAGADSAAHDLWLTRNGHGAGFWDRPELYGEKLSSDLTEAAQAMGEVWPYVGDDGLIYMN